MIEENRVNMVAPPSVQGMTPLEKDQFERLYTLWNNKLTRNRLRKKYYRQKNSLKDLGIAIPPNLKTLETCLGWAAKSVDILASRSRFDGFVYKDEVQGIDGVLRDNNFKVMYKQAVNSELVHSCVFFTVSKGGNGEQDVIISAYSAENAAAIWDSRKKRIECGFTVIEVDDKTKQPTWINLYNDEEVLELRKDAAGWNLNRLYHSQGRPLMEPMVFKPDLDRPMGRSRITRTVMSITDSAIRTALRSEVSAEFFTSPQKYLLGVDDSIFDNQTKWEAYIGNIFSVTRDENGDIPKFGQLAQGSMQPHTEYMRSLAQQFAGETNIPVSALGIVQDNPSSAEAIRAAENYLIIDAEELNETNGVALRNVGLLAHAIAGKTTVDKLSEEVKSIEPKFRNPSVPSIASQADAMVKQISAIPWLADTQVALEELGYSESQIMRLMSDKKRMQAQQVLAAIQAQIAGTQVEEQQDA